MSDYKAKFGGVEMVENEDGEMVADLDIAGLAEIIERAPQHITGYEYAADNVAQAAFGAAALVAFVNRVGENEMETNVSDLLACLMHLCDALGIDFDQVVRSGRNHYVAEREAVGL